MNDHAKAMRGLALFCALLGLFAYECACAHIDELTRRDLEVEELRFQRSGAIQAAQAAVLYQMDREGRCAPSLKFAAALPCRPGGPIAGVPKAAAGAAWTVSP